MKNKLLITTCALVCACSLSGCGSALDNLISFDPEGMEILVNADAETGNNQGSIITEESSASAEETLPSVDLSNGAVFIPADGVTVVEDTEASLPSFYMLEPYATNDPLADINAAAPEPSYAVYEAPTELSENILDFQISVDGVILQLPMWYSDMEALGLTYTGDPNEKLESYTACYSDDWNLGQNEISTKFTNFASSTKPFSECTVTGIDISDYDLADNCEVLLPGGIVFGESKYEDVIAAYGTPTDEYKSDVTSSVEYSIDYDQCVRIAFDGDTGVIFSVDIDNQIELEGTDHSVNTEVPEMFNNYVAPTSVSADFSGYDVQYAGKYYSLPCPVTKLIENGFKLVKTEYTSESVASGDYADANFTYNGETFTAHLYNFADYATIPENCYVYALEAKTEYSPNVEMTIPHGISIGTSEADVLKVLENYEYDTYASSVFTYVTYFVDDPNSYLNSYEITIDGGVVTELKAECRTKPE